MQQDIEFLTPSVTGKSPHSFRFARTQTREVAGGLTRLDLMEMSWLEDLFSERLVLVPVWGWFWGCFKETLNDHNL